MVCAGQRERTEWRATGVAPLRDRWRLRTAYIVFAPCPMARDCDYSRRITIVEYSGIVVAPGRPIKFANSGPVNIA